MTETYTLSKATHFTEATEDIAEPLNASDYKEAQIVYTSCKARHFTEATEDVAYTLVGTDYKDPPLVTEPVVLESNQNHATITQSGVSPTLSASMGLGGGYVPMITEEL